MKEVRDIGKELRTHTRRLEEWELTCWATDGSIAGAGGQRVSVSVPNTLETLTGPLEASCGGVTLIDKVRRSREGSLRVWRLPSQSQGSEPGRGIELKAKELSEFEKRRPSEKEKEKRRPSDC